VFPIEGKLANLRKEVEEREEQRQKERLEELRQRLTSLDLVKREIASFDFQNQPIAFLADIIFAGAVANRVSDIHFEPEAEAIKIRYRIDGLLNDLTTISSDYYKLLLSRLKLLANLKLNVTDRPQDGRFSLAFAQKDIEVRASLVPSEYGETLVLRLLDPQSILNLEDLGMRPDDLAMVNEELAAPNGMILNTGPTGSGKTTTLYAFLKKKQTPGIKIITIEDPIEYHLEGVEQTQVVADGDYNFANGLRAILRQDPDVILIGEIRDQETAAIAIQAALTGHLVFSTVHANEAAGAIPRLLDLEAKTTSIGPALNLVMAQRLVRQLCADCKKPKTITAELQEQLEKILSTLPSRVDKSKVQDVKLFDPAGCNSCNHTGYQGRIGIFELLRVGSEVEALIEKQASETEIQQLAISRQAMVTMQQDGFYKATQGITTLEEVEAATGPWKG